METIIDIFQQKKWTKLSIKYFFCIFYPNIFISKTNWLKMKVNLQTFSLISGKPHTYYMYYALMFSVAFDLKKLSKKMNLFGQYKNMYELSRLCFYLHGKP